MRISEVIAELEKVKKEKGDIPVLVREDGFGGYGISTFGGLDEDTIHVAEFTNNEEGMTFAEEIVKEHFPEWDGEEDADLKTDVLVVRTGEQIYST